MYSAWNFSDEEPEQEESKREDPAYMLITRTDNWTGQLVTKWVLDPSYVPRQDPDSKSGGKEPIDDLSKARENTRSKEPIAKFSAKKGGHLSYAITPGTPRPKGYICLDQRAVASETPKDFNEIFKSSDIGGFIANCRTAFPEEEADSEDEDSTFTTKTPAAARTKTPGDKASRADEDFRRGKISENKKSREPIGIFLRDPSARKAGGIT